MDRLVPVANPEQMVELNHLFTSKAKISLGDDHLWFSVLARPPLSRFTVLQRVSCCLLLLITSMLANAMFYEKGDNTGGQNALTFGPFSLSPEQVRYTQLTDSFICLGCFLSVFNLLYHNHLTIPYT